MRYACYVVSALLAIALAGAIGVGQEVAIEAVPEEAVEEAVEEAAEPAPLEVDPEEMRKSVLERLTQVRTEWLARVRETLGVEADEDWAKMATLIAKLEQLQRIRDYARQKGQILFYAQGLSGEDLMTAADRIQEQFLSMNPDLPEDDVKPLAAAHTALADAFHNKDATDEEVSKSLVAWRQAAGEFDAKVDQASAELAKMATPRQRAGLVLMDILDASATAPKAP